MKPSLNKIWERLKKVKYLRDNPNSLHLKIFEGYKDPQDTNHQAGGQSQSFINYFQLESPFQVITNVLIWWTIVVQSPQSFP